MMWDWAPWWHWLSMAGVWVLGIGVIVWAVASLFPASPRNDARQILDERLARGDLAMDDYRRLRDELETRRRARTVTRD